MGGLNHSKGSDLSATDVCMHIASSSSRGTSIQDLKTKKKQAKWSSISSRATQLIRLRNCCWRKPLTPAQVWKRARPRWWQVPVHSLENSYSFPHSRSIIYRAHDCDIDFLFAFIQCILVHETCRHAFTICDVNVMHSSIITHLTTSRMHRG